MAANPTLILGSASPRRVALLNQLKLDFVQLVSPAEEPAPGNRGPAEHVVESARLKALAVATLAISAPPPSLDNTDSLLIIGADTIVCVDGAILGKPRDAADAMAMLGALRGRQHEVVTGVAVCANDEDIVDAVTSRVTMREYAAAEVAFYVAGGSPLDKAGAYAIQDAAFAPVADCDGCECSVMGLPLWTVAYMLTRAGVRALDAPTFERCADCPERRDQP